jgi:hypothetical protein
VGKRTCTTTNHRRIRKPPCQRRRAVPPLTRQRKGKYLATSTDLVERGCSVPRLDGKHGNLPGRNTGIPGILVIPAVTRNSRVLRSGNSASGQPRHRGGRVPKVQIHVSFFVVLLRVHSQWGLEKTKPTPAGRKTARMVSS